MSSTLRGNNAMRFHLAMIAVASAWAFNASAGPVTSIDWGHHDPVESAFVHPKGNADAFILFTLKDAMWVVSTAESRKRKGGTVYLFNDADEVLVGSFRFGGDMGEIAHEFDLQAGDYYYRIDSTGPGASGGVYTLSSSLSAEAGLVGAGMTQAEVVPEPHSVALVLAGLMALGWSMKGRNP